MPDPKKLIDQVEIKVFDQGDGTCLIRAVLAVTTGNNKPVPMTPAIMVPLIADLKKRAISLMMRDVQEAVQCLRNRLVRGDVPDGPFSDLSELLACIDRALKGEA